MANLSLLLLIFLISRQTYISQVHAKKVREIFGNDVKRILQKILQNERLQSRHFNRRPVTPGISETKYPSLEGDYREDLQPTFLERTGGKYVEGIPKPPDLPPPPQLRFEDLPEIPKSRFKKVEGFAAGIIASSPLSRYRVDLTPWSSGRSERIQLLHDPPPPIPAFPELPDWERLIRVLPAIQPYNEDITLKRLSKRRRRR